MINNISSPVEPVQLQPCRRSWQCLQMPQTLDDSGAQSRLKFTDIERFRKREGLSVLQERTNSVAGVLNVINTVHEQRAVAAPYTVLNSGAPLTPNPLSSSVSSPIRAEEKEQWGETQVDTKNVRRLNRYSAAEEKLAKTFQNCNAEPSPQELQIRALEKATSILNSHAHDARDRAQELQAVLSDREMDRAAFEALKRERWMEEKRQLAVEEERKVVLGHLEALTKTAHNDASHTHTHTPTTQARKHTNLIKFLESSQTHKPIHSHAPNTHYMGRSQRRRTMDKVSPMRLRTSSTTYNFMDPPKHHLRSISLDGRVTFHPILPQAKPLSKPNLPIHRIPLSVVTEYVALDSPHTCTTTEPSDQSTTFDELPSTPLTTATSNPLHATVPSNLSCEQGADPNDEGGIATIFQSTPRTAADLIGNIHVSLPDYAVDLFMHFETDMAPLQPISYPSDPRAPKKIPPSLQQPNSYTPGSSSLQVSSAKDPPIQRSSSHRNLRSLISFPDALSSRLGVEKSGQERQGHGITPRSSTISLVTPGDTRGGIAKRVKKRFSALRMH